MKPIHAVAPRTVMFRVYQPGESGKGVVPEKPASAPQAAFVGQVVAPGDGPTLRAERKVGGHQV